MDVTKSVCQEETFKSIFSEHAEALVNFIFYKSGNYAEAEDLMQDAFSKLWEQCRKVPFEKAKSFLFTVANNAFLNVVKHKKIVLKFEQKGHSQLSQVSPQYLMEEAEFKEKLERAISALPDNQRTIFLMNRIDKMKYREIAEKLGISIKTVEKRMGKTLIELRKISKNL